MAFNNLVLSWCKDPCNPCHYKLLSAEEYETVLENFVTFTNYMFASVPVAVQASRTTTLSYNLTKSVDLFQDSPPITPGPVGKPSFVWPVQKTAFYNTVSIDYYGGAATYGIVPCTILYGLLNNGLGDGFFDQTGLLYQLRPDLGYPLALSALIEISISYLGVEIFSTTMSFNYTGFKYAISPGWGEVGIAIYPLTSITMSPIPNTPFEVSKEVAGRRGWIWTDVPTHILHGPYAQYLPYYAPPPINPKNGNYQFTGFAYNGPIDYNQDIVFVVKAKSISAPSQPPPDKVYASLDDFESNVAQPPIIDCQFVLGQGLYASYGKPIKVYDYADLGF